LSQLPKLPKLKRLVLDGNEIRGVGLAALSAQPALVELSLGCPTLTDLFANNLAKLKQVKRLSLAGSGLGDAGIQHLEGLTNLEALDLRKTKVTAAGIERLQKALPKCKIEWDGAK
jgi:Leucine-rich repeat (LRR) protein